MVAAALPGRPRLRKAWRRASGPRRCRRQPRNSTWDRSARPPSASIDPSAKRPHVAASANIKRSMTAARTRTRKHMIQKATERRGMGASKRRMAAGGVARRRNSGSVPKNPMTRSPSPRLVHSASAVSVSRQRQRQPLLQQDAQDRLHRQTQQQASERADQADQQEHDPKMADDKPPVAPSALRMAMVRRFSRSRAPSVLPTPRPAISRVKAPTKER